MDDSSKLGKMKEQKPKRGRKDRAYHNIFMAKTAIELLDKPTFSMKVEDRKLTRGDVVHEALKLLAKERGMEA